MLKNLSLLVLVFLVVGCATKVDLDPYKPVSAQQQSNHINLFVQGIIPQKDSDVEESKGLAIRVKSDATSWLQQAFKGELTNAGYSVTIVEEPGEPQTEEKLLDNHAYYVYYQPSEEEKEKFALEISVKQGDKEILRKVYSSRRPVIVRLYELFGGLKFRVNKIMRRAFQDLSSQFIEDLNAELLKAKASTDQV